MVKSLKDNWIFTNGEADEKPPSKFWFPAFGIDHEMPSMKRCCHGKLIKGHGLDQRPQLCSWYTKTEVEFLVKWFSSPPLKSWMNPCHAVVSTGESDLSSSSSLHVSSFERLKVNWLEWDETFMNIGKENKERMGALGSLARFQCYFTVNSPSPSSLKIK